MRNSITRLVALACFLGLALALIWIGLAHTPARESNPKNNKPITARERAAMLYSSPSSPLVTAYQQASRQRAASRPTPKHSPPQQFSIAKAWRAHEGAKVNPVPVALPEGTAFVRGIPAHPTRVVARMRPEISRNALANALDGVGVYGYAEAQQEYGADPVSDAGGVGDLVFFGMGFLDDFGCSGQSAFVGNEDVEDG